MNDIQLTEAQTTLGGVEKLPTGAVFTYDAVGQCFDHTTAGGTLYRVFQNQRDKLANAGLMFTDVV